MIKPWKTLSSRHVLQDQFLSLRTDRCQREDGHIVPTYHVLEFTEWVTLIPITDAGEVILVREYRHAAGKILLGLPGGVSDPGETELEAAAARELREETGYQCRDLIPVGTCYANPATQTNQVHYYLGLGAALKAPQDLDPNEEIEVITMPYHDFLAYDALEVQHGLHAAALFYAERHFMAHPAHRPAAKTGLPEGR